jgi:hypothetical protein
MSGYAGPKDMTGSLRSVPDEDRKTSKHPTARGQCMIDGKRYWISGWTRSTENEDGTKSRWVTLAFNPMEEKKAPAQAPAPKPDTEDNIPW